MRFSLRNMAEIWYGAVILFLLATTTSAVVQPFASKLVDVGARRMVSAYGVRIPHGFEAFGKSLSVREDTSTPELTELVDCPEVAEPALPTEVPSWATGTAVELRDQGFEELVDVNSGIPVRVFVSGSEVVMKRCSSSALISAIKRTAANWDNMDPNWDIYFDCDPDRRFMIEVGQTIQFGRGSKAFAGTWRLLAPHYNVVLDGQNSRRIMQVASRAHLTVYGLTFRAGAEVMEQMVELSEVPYGGWNGGAILVFTNGALTAYKCRFVNNRALSYYARWGGGGAIKAETRSYLMIWGCDFKHNHASVGGAIASSSAHVVYIRKSRFYRNAAFGGVDRSDGKKMREKPNLLVRGGAIRVDQVTGHSNMKEHVVICNVEFTRNMIVFQMRTLREKFGFGKEDLHLLRAAGAAVTLWNSPGNLELEQGNSHFALVKGCVFSENVERIGPMGMRLGRFVFEAEGAGRFKMTDTVFKNNTVARALARIDNSSRFVDGMSYEMFLKNINFEDNGDAYNLEFEAQMHQSTCTFANVLGIDDATGDCRQIILDAIANGCNMSMMEGGA